MIILSLGFILLAGLFASKLIRRLKLPTVTAYLLLGILIGPSLLNLVSSGILRASGLITNVVLGFIAFSLGQNFLIATFRRIGRPVLWISILEATGAWILVTFVFLIVLKQPLYIALLFGAIASATAPATTMMVIREYKAKGSFTDTLLGVVAIDDAWCLIIFAVSLAISKAIVIHHPSNAFLFQVISRSFLEILGAFALGGLSAVLLAYLSRYAVTPMDMLVYTLGFILLNTGLALYFNISVLLTNMLLGAVLVNVHKVSFKFFDTLRAIDSPIYLIFFVLAGANLELGLIGKLGVLGGTYMLFRSIGKIGGAMLGGYISHAPSRITKYIGLGLLPQAGVALGVALVAKSSFPQVGNLIFSVIVATTVVYELVGPLLTKFALKRAGEI